jgi:hypothetical protein
MFLQHVIQQALKDHHAFHTGDHQHRGSDSPDPDPALNLLLS